MSLLGVTINPSGRSIGGFSNSLTNGSDPERNSEGKVILVVVVAVSIMFARPSLPIAFTASLTRERVSSLLGPSVTADDPNAFATLLIWSRTIGLGEMG